jgi:sulfur-oxidizing protein SoxX
LASLLLALALAAAGPPVRAESLRPYQVANGEIEEPLTGKKGDPARGRAIVVDRQAGLCLLCHSGPFPEARQQGDLAPSLAGAGSRNSEGRLRLRIVDSRRLNPATIMPSYYRVEGLHQVGKSWQGKPVLTAEQIEDVVAFLVTLKTP